MVVVWPMARRAAGVCQGGVQVPEVCLGDVVGAALRSLFKNSKLPCEFEPDKVSEAT